MYQLGVVGDAGLRIGVLDLTGLDALISEAGRGNRELAVGIVECRCVAGYQCEKVGAGAAHDRLVIIVADRVEIRHLFEERRVAGIHVEEAHGETALVGVVRGGAETIIVIADTGRLGNPDKQILLVLVADLLPHLEEAMHRIAGEIAKSHVA